MTCDDAQNALLEADLTDLSADRLAGRLEEHLEQCAQCETIAWRLMNAHGALVEAFASPPPRSADEIVDAVLASATTDPRPTWWQRKAVAWAIAVPMASAAAFAAVLLSRPGPSGPAVAPPSPTSTLFENVSEVEVPEGHGVAIFRTSDPMITVVWIYEENEP